MAIIGKDTALGVDIQAHSTGNRFRRARFAIFKSMINEVIAEKGCCRILDVGGTPKFWQTWGEILPKSVSITVSNLHGDFPANTGQLTFHTADACQMPYDDNSFDLVHSNSVIEHVGAWSRQASMAREIQRVAPRYFVQTPNYWFPVEPHARTLFFHWLPEPMRASLLLKQDRGFLKKAPDIGRATELYQSAILLDIRQMKFLFPRAEVRREKFYGLTKSLIAIKR